MRCSNGCCYYYRTTTATITTVQLSIHVRPIYVNSMETGVWSLDRDDTSQFINDVGNWLVWGGSKDYLGSHKTCDSNFILYPGLSGRSAGNRRCQTDDDGKFAKQYHRNNVCTTADGHFYSFSNCNGANVNTSVYVTRNNTLLSDRPAVFNQGCPSDLTFAQWQALGQDAGSRVGATPDVATLIAMGAAKVLGAGRE